VISVVRLNLDPYQISDPATKTEYFDTSTSVSTALTELAGFISPAVSASVGKVIKTTDALNHASYTIYDKFGCQIATYDATKHRTSASQYDAVNRVAGNLTDVIDSLIRSQWQSVNG
jgi:hypothetical protein